MFSHFLVVYSLNDYFILSLLWTFVANFRRDVLNRLPLTESRGKDAGNRTLGLYVVSNIRLFNVSSYVEGSLYQDCGFMQSHSAWTTCSARHSDWRPLVRDIGVARGAPAPPRAVKFFFQA